MDDDWFIDHEADERPTDAQARAGFLVVPPPMSKEEADAILAAFKADACPVVFEELEAAA